MLGVVFNSILSASAPIAFTIAPLISGKWASCCACNCARAGCARTMVDVATQNTKAVIERRSAGALAIVQASALENTIGMQTAETFTVYDLDQFFGGLLFINSKLHSRVNCRWPHR
jgi:hypothetical protein